MSQFALYVRGERTARGLSQRALSDVTRIARADIAQMEAGTRKPTVDNAHAIADALVLDAPQRAHLVIAAIAARNDMSPLELMREGQAAFEYLKANPDAPQSPPIGRSGVTAHREHPDAQADT